MAHWMGNRLVRTRLAAGLEAFSRELDESGDGQNAYEIAVESLHFDSGVGRVILTSFPRWTRSREMLPSDSKTSQDTNPDSKKRYFPRTCSSYQKPTSIDH